MSTKLDLKDYFYIQRFMKPRMAAYLFGLLGHCITDTTILISIPFLMKFMIDAAIQGKISLLKEGLIAAVFFAFLISLCFVVTATFLRQSINRTLTDIRTALFTHIQNLPVAYFEQNHSGDLLSRISSDMKSVEYAIGWPLRMAVFILISGMGSAIAMLMIDWKVGLVLMGIGILSAYVNSKYAVAIKRISEKTQKAMAALTEKMSDVFCGAVVIKMFHTQTKMLHQVQEKNNAVFDLEMARVKKAGQLDSINFLISWINFGGIVAVGALLFVNGMTEMGSVVALTQLLGSVNFMVRRLGGILAHLQGCMAGVSRIAELFRVNEEPERYETPAAASSAENMIAFESVSFAYQENQPVLNQLNLTVGSGKVAALVGYSGEGKSTIIKLLLGFYAPGSGKISINNRGLGCYTLEELRSIMTYVPQDAYLFDGTIEENILYGRPSATQDELIAAAQAANAHDFIMAMPEGYRTVIGERGIRLSGGQKQRIAIARALLKNAPILLLDEATSSLDSQSEQLVQSALANLMQGRTVVVVAHRLSTIQHADIIYVIDGGMVAEAGQHEELLKKDGLYARFHRLQFHLEDKEAI